MSASQVFENADAVLPDACVRRLHRLVWCPGEWISATWWAYFGLAEWHDAYQRHGAVRAPLDALLIARRGYSVGALPTELGESARALLSIDPRRFPRLVTALGLVHSGRSEWFLFSRWRSALNEQFTPAECEQLMFFCALRGERDAPADQWGADLAPEGLSTRACMVGYQWLDAQLRDDVAWRALEILLPAPPSPRTAPTSDAGQNPHSASSDAPADALSWLFRLERFLC